MINKKKYILFFFLQLHNFYQLNASDAVEYAVIIKPVVDLTGQPLRDLSFYNNISFSPMNKKDHLSCPRFHQLLFNETVKILEKDGDEYIIELPWVFFQQADSSIKKNKYRILKKNLMSFSYLKKFNINFDKFPKPIDYNQSQNTKFEKTITLKGPFHDIKTDKVYSAGTRFIFSDLDEEQLNYNVYIFNPTYHHFITTKIPKKLCINNFSDCSKEKKISNFVKLLKKWANLKNGFIPYVWGGCSFCSAQDDQNFVEIKRHLHKKQIQYYEYPEYNNNPKNGFDCSGMILRAAQICGLPYYFKNSITAAQNMETLNNTDEVMNGDIIWIPGHVIVISDVNNNLIVEATDYSTGYGKIHENEISKLFKDIKNFNDLKDCLLNKKALKRLNKSGEVFQTITNFKILKIQSLWKN